MNALRAFTFRELRAALLNRFMQIFTVTALLTGLAPLLNHATGGDLAPLFLLQPVLYLVPLFALLIGTGSAQGDLEERAFLFAQPGGRAALVFGKFLALWLLLSTATLALVLPGMLADTAVKPLALLWLHAVGTAGVFLAIGLACGFSTNDRVKAHLAALCLWLVFLAGFNLLALAGAHTPWMQGRPELWTSLLMLNPLDALRIGALFAVDRIPFDVSQAAPLVRWWLANLGLWFALLSAAWIALALAWSRRRVEHSAL
jgi:phosphotransferase system  glucose/maltose/N-acetylglucosamine-specific IIC component